MSSLTNINNNSSVVNVGRTVPVSTGQKSSDQSIPVVIADDQSPIPVVEQNKIQSEVALSLLGIPRSEVALGIFADVNTYDVNPSEWSSSPQTYIDGYGTKHSPTEAGAIVEAPRDKTAVLTSKRFFRYQPGRVSAATFGIKNSVALPKFEFAQNPVIKKYGIFDKYDGYYWETRQSGEGDNFTVVRRTQSLYKTPSSPFGAIDDPADPPLLRGYNASASEASLTKAQTEDYRIVGTTPSAEIEESTLFVKERKALAQARFSIADAAWTNAYTGQFKIAYDELTTADAKEKYQAKCKRDVDYWIDMYIMDLAAGGDAHTAINTKNYETSVAVRTTTAPHEITLHTAAKAAILDEFSTGSNDIKARLTELTNITINFFKDVDSDATNPYALPTSYGNKTKLATMFDARRHYWAYYVSEYAYNADYPNTNGAAITYLPANDTAEAEAVIKYKCQRDMLYIIDGYRDDLTGGGNGATKFNASMYYNNDSVHDKYAIYSQTTGTGVNTVIAEIARHTHLRIRIAADMANSYYGITDSAVKDKFYKDGDTTALANIIVNNFSIENKANTVYGNTAVAGNLIVLRDGLIMVHAAVFDSGLLKEQTKIKAQLYATTDTIKLTEDHVTFGQHVKYFGATNGGLRDNTLYKVKTVYGPKGNEFSLVTEAGAAVNVANNTTGEFQLVNPFIFPTAYSSAVYNSTSEFAADTFPKGMMFPYLYSENGELPLGSARGVGFIDTGINTSFELGTDELSRQIDAVNFVPEYINWIKNNVKPEYYGVYEFRIPRSRFSTDQLNGQTNRVLYSDVASNEDGPVKPGQGVKNAVGEPLTNASAYNFDFTKVSMLKIEFSWYGAVGALFLAYVPIGNGEARWVRVHHLRASNQLKISSLGNATLPITYSVYGGGSVNSLGDGDTTDNQGYGRASHNLVKYGASYYIDGGDRGTVRLYSHNNNEVTKVYGRKYALGTVALEFDTDIGLYWFRRPTSISGISSVFFMNAKITTPNRIDQNIKVAWVEGTKIYLSKAPSNTDSIDITLTPDRANTVYGLETKREITSSDGFKVRNRVQVYPTKMSTANLGSVPIRLRMKKTPLFQTAANPSGTFNLTVAHTVTAENRELTTDTPAYLDDGESVYGWFRGIIGTGNLTVFGKLYKISTSYYFEILENYNGIVTLSSGKFVHDLRFDPAGVDLATGVSKGIEEKEGISSVVIATDTQVPVAGTGIDVATLYLKAGTEQIDLSTYYDFNKEYLSYPLTDFADSLYLSVDTEELSSTTPGDVSISITWEEQ